MFVQYFSAEGRLSHVLMSQWFLQTICSFCKFYYITLLFFFLSPPILCSCVAKIPFLFCDKLSDFYILLSCIRDQILQLVLTDNLTDKFCQSSFSFISFLTQPVALSYIGYLKKTSESFSTIDLLIAFLLALSLCVDRV